MSAGAPVRLVTPRYELRTRTGADPTDAFRRWAADAAMMNPMNLPARSLTAEQVAAYWAGFDNRERFFFGIADLATGREVGFWTVEGNLIHGSAAVHHAVDPGWWRQDVAVETGVALIDWLFEVQRFEKLTGGTLPANAKVVHFLKLGGWQEEGYLRQELRSMVGPGRLDQLKFGLLPEEWRAAKAGLLARAKMQRPGM